MKAKPNTYGGTQTLNRPSDIETNLLAAAGLVTEIYLSTHIYIFRINVCACILPVSETRGKLLRSSPYYEW